MSVSRSVLGAMVATLIVAGCVNVAGPSAEPSITPAPPAPTPSSLPSSLPTASPTATVAPTITAAPTPTVAPTPEPTDDPGFDQRDVVFLDDLGDPNGHCTTEPAQDPPVYPEDCWGVGTNEGGTVGYVNGALHLETSATGAWMYSRRLADEASATMRVIGDFHPTNEGRFGLVCASGDGGEEGDGLFGAIVGTDGSWAFMSVGPSGADELFGDASGGLDVVPDASNVVALECTGTATGALRMTLWLGKSGPVATWTQPDGPATFDRAGTYVDSSGEGFSVAMDNVVVFGTGMADGSFSPEGEDLLAHVPADWQPSCYQGIRPPYLAETAEAVVTCFLSSSNGDGSELAEYVSYSSAADMEAAYQSRIDAFGSGGGVNSCRDGSGEHTYNFGEGTPDVGRLLCVDQFAGIRFDWTDTRLNILSTLVDFDGDYDLTFDDWVKGGPNS